MKRWIVAYYVWLRIWWANYRFPLLGRYKAWRDRHFVRGFGDGLAGSRQSSEPMSYHVQAEYLEGFKQGVTFRQDLAAYRDEAFQEESN